MKSDPCRVLNIGERIVVDQPGDECHGLHGVVVGHWPTPTSIDATIILDGDTDRLVFDDSELELEK